MCQAVTICVLTTTREAGALTPLALQIRKQRHRSDYAVAMPTPGRPPFSVLPCAPASWPLWSFLASLSQPVGGPRAGGGVTSSQPLTTAEPCFSPGGGGSFPLVPGTG